MPKQKYRDPSLDSEMEFHDAPPVDHVEKGRKHNLTEVSVNNGFAALEAIGDKEVVQIANSKQNSTKKVKIPLITLTEISLSDAQSVILRSGISIFNTKRTSTGINVYVYSTGDYKLLIDFLKKLNVHFFTYVLDEDRTTKIVLSGLHDMDIVDVTTILDQANVKPLQIRKMTLKKKKYEDHALYILYFRKGSILINNLRKIRSLHHCIVYWDYYSSKNNGPIQCRNCQMFGHGSTHCFRQPRCVKCGEGHATVHCPLTANRTNEADKLSNEVLKCANCSLQHTANYSKCAKRIEFVNARSLMNQRKTSPKNHFILRQSQFPTLGEQVNTRTKDQKPECSYASKVRSGLNPSISFTNRDQQGTYINLTNTSIKTNTDSKLFSHTELIQIINTAFSRLSECITKQDQVRVILEIVSLYCFPLNG